jgi:hypothetical protein
MPPRAEMLRNRTIGGKEALSVSWGLEALHPLFSLARRLVGILSAVVQVAVLPMLHTGQDLAHGRPVASQLICDDHPWHVRQALEQLTEECLCGLLVPPALHQNVEDVPLLIDRTPEVMAFPVDRQEHFIQVPLVAELGPSMPELIGIPLAELAAPLPDSPGFSGKIPRP